MADIFVPIVATNVAAICIIGALAFGGRRGVSSVPRSIQYVPVPATVTAVPAATADAQASDTDGKQATPSSLADALKGSSASDNKDNKDNEVNKEVQSLEYLLKSSTDEMNTLKKAVDQEGSTPRAADPVPPSALDIYSPPTAPPAARY